MRCATWVFVHRDCDLGGCSKKPDGVLAWARSLGADAALAKPFEIEWLITLVIQCTAAAARKAAAPPDAPD